MAISSEVETEIVGVSPWLVGEILAIITLLVPMGILPAGGEINFYGVWLLGPSMYGFLWVLGSDFFVAPITLHVIDLPYMLVTVPLSIFSIFYIRQIVRYYFGKSSRHSALMTGLLSLVFPFLISLLWPASFGIALIIPVPVQFLVGLYILHRFEGPEAVIAQSEAVH